MQVYANLDGFISNGARHILVYAYDVNIHNAQTEFYILCMLTRTLKHSRYLRAA